MLKPILPVPLLLAGPLPTASQHLAPPAPSRGGLRGASLWDKPPLAVAVSQDAARIIRFISVSKKSAQNSFSRLRQAPLPSLAPLEKTLFLSFRPGAHSTFHSSALPAIPKFLPPLLPPPLRQEYSLFFDTSNKSRLPLVPGGEKTGADTCHFLVHAGPLLLEKRKKCITTRRLCAGPEPYRYFPTGTGHHPARSDRRRPSCGRSAGAGPGRG